MEHTQYPAIIITKSAVPTIYLDTCTMIELSRHEKGNCTDAHRQEIGELYDTLAMLMRHKKVHCILGNQLQEMGISKGRAPSRDFLFRFTNLELQHPYLIEKTQLDLGYRAYINHCPSLELDIGMVTEHDPQPDSQFIVHVAPVYSQEKLQKTKESKLSAVAMLNNMKKNGHIEKDYATQLETEFKSDFQVFLHTLEHANDSIESLSLYFDTLRIVCKRAGIPLAASDQELISAVNIHNRFLLSSYHHKLPYKHIEAVLWATRMQRPDKIQNGDNLDTIWAAAYLPFVHYAVTDNAFCTLLQSSGLAEHYGTNVFSHKSLNGLLEDLKSLACIYGQ